MNKQNSTPVNPGVEWPDPTDADFRFLPVLPDRIPAQLKALPRWLAWRGEPGSTGTTTKIPYRVDGRGKASSTNPDTWTDFSTALASMNGQHHGLGLALAKDLTFIDLDHVRNPQTGEVAAWAAAIIAEVNSYAELSPSGDGLHIYSLGSLPGPGAKQEFSDGSALEIYDCGRYTTVTGQHLDGTPVDINAADVGHIYRRLKEKQLGPQQDRTTAPLSPPPIRRDRVTDSGVRELLAKWNLTIVTVEQYQGNEEVGTKYVLADCPFNPGQGHKDTAVFDYPSGPVFDCFHASCKDFGWRELQQKFAPSADDWYDKLILGEKGKCRPLLTNAALLLRHSPEWVGVLVYDEFALQVKTAGPPPWEHAKPNAIWTDDDDSRTACWLQQREVAVNSKVAGEAAGMVGREHPFHPVRDYLRDLVWDKKPRIDAWLRDYLGAEDCALNANIGAKWLISGVARIMRPGSKVDATLLLEGPQGIGKSTALEILASSPWFSDHLSDLGTKDSRIELHGKWIIELSEFVNRRSELERKAFLTACADNFRAPYERRAQWVPRTNVFAGTTNDPCPLTDETGGRRYWPVTCGKIDIEKLKADRDQLWAEAYVRYLEGESWHDDFAEFRAALKEEQEARYMGGPNDEAILEWLADPRQAERWEPQGEGRVRVTLEPFDSNRERVTIADVLQHCLNIPRGKVDRKDQLAVRACLMHAGWRRDSKQTKVPGAKRVVHFYRKEVTTI